MKNICIEYDGWLLDIIFEITPCEIGYHISDSSCQIVVNEIYCNGANVTDKYGTYALIRIEELIIIQLNEFNTPWRYIE